MSVLFYIGSFAHSFLCGGDAPRCFEVLDYPSNVRGFRLVLPRLWQSSAQRMFKFLETSRAVAPMLGERHRRGVQVNRRERLAVADASVRRGSESICEAFEFAQHIRGNVFASGVFDFQFVRLGFAAEIDAVKHPNVALL